MILIQYFQDFLVQASVSISELIAFASGFDSFLSHQGSQVIIPLLVTQMTFQVWKFST